MGVCTCVGTCGSTQKSVVNILLCYSSAPSHLVYEAGSLTGTPVWECSQSSTERKKATLDVGGTIPWGPRLKRKRGESKPSIGIWEAMWPTASRCCLYAVPTTMESLSDLRTKALPPWNPVMAADAVLLHSWTASGPHTVSTLHIHQHTLWVSDWQIAKCFRPYKESYVCVCITWLYIHMCIYTLYIYILIQSPKTFPLLFFFHLFI